MSQLIVRKNLIDLHRRLDFVFRKIGLKYSITTYDEEVGFTSLVNLDNQTQELLSVFNLKIDKLKLVGWNNPVFMVHTVDLPKFFRILKQELKYNTYYADVRVMHVLDTTSQMTKISLLQDFSIFMDIIKKNVRHNLFNSIEKIGRNLDKTKEKLEKTTRERQDKIKKLAIYNEIENYLNNQSYNIYESGFFNKKKTFIYATKENIKKDLQDICKDNLSINYEDFSGIKSDRYCDFDGLLNYLGSKQTNEKNGEIKVKGKKSTEEDISRHETEISQLKQKIEEFKQFLPLLDKKELLLNTSIEFSIEELKELHQQVVLFEQHPILSRI